MPKSTPSNFLDELLKREYYDKIHLSKKIVNDRLKVAQNLYNKNFLAHYGCVNAIEFLNGGQFLASGGDDRRVLLWNIQEALQGVGSPNAMRAQHVSNIFCIGYDSKNTRLFSAGNDDQVIIHDIHTGDPLDFFLYEQPVYGLSVDPSNDDVFASACDDGRVLVYDIREPSSTEPLVLARCTAAFHGVMYNPAESRLLATANAKEGACLWDVRKPQHPLLTYGSTETPQSSMSVRWNNNGSLLLALRRRLPPVLYQIDSPVPVAQFDHPGYFNSCTMKSCCFAGYDDEYVLSGSDDFNLYMWKIPPLDKTVKGGAWVSNAHVVLGGHRSIVNQVRFNPDNYLIASSGVEKLIKIWSPFPLPLSSGGLEKETVACKKRKVFSHEEYISLVMRSGQIITHDYSQESTKEDPRMMAFFDSLVQREIEGWSSDDSAHTDSVLSPPPLYSDHSLSDSSDKCDDETEEEEEEEDDDNDNDNENEDQTGGNGGEDDSLVIDQTTPTRRKKNKSNPIVKLIAKKRAQLMRLAKINHTIVTRNSNLNSSSLLSQETTTNDNTTTSNGINFGDSYTNSQTSTSTGATRSSTRNSISSSSTSSSNSSSSCSKSSDNSTSSHSNISNDNDSDINDVSKPIANGKGKKRKRISKSNKKYKRSNHLLSIAQLYSSDTSSTDNSSDSDEDFYIDVNHSDNNDSNNNDKDCDGHDSIKDKSKKLESSSNKSIKHCFKKRKSSLKFCSNNNYNNEKINTLDKKNESLIKNSLKATTTKEERRDDVDGNRDEIRNKTPINNSSTVINNDLINSSTSNTPDCIPNTPESNAVRTGTEAETQDSGIFLSDNSSIMDSGNKKLISNSKYKHRNYRKRISCKSDSE